jgi:hypothetical protein
MMMLQRSMGKGSSMACAHPTDFKADSTDFCAADLLRGLRPVRLAYQPPATTVFFSQNKLTNQPTVLFSQNK